METKYIKLYSILKKAYCIKYNIEDEESIISGESSSFDEYKKDETKRLKLILASLGIHLENYKEDRKVKKHGRKNKKTEVKHYNIPVKISPIILGYLLEESKTNSIMSYLKRDCIEKVTNEQILKLNNNIFNLLREENKNESKVLEEINLIEEHYVEMLTLDYQWKCKKEKIIESLNRINRINLEVLNIVDKKDKIIRFEPDYVEQDYEDFYKQSMSKFEEYYNKKSSLGNSRNNINYLDYYDINVLSEYYFKLMKDIDEKWMQIIDEYVSLKTEIILNEDVTEKKDLSKYIISEYIEVLKNRDRCINEKKNIPESVIEFLNKNKYKN